MIETLKITSGSPELLRKIQRDVIRLLGEYEANPVNQGQRSAAQVAVGKTRIVPGER